VDDLPVIFYTCVDSEKTQRQCLAYPENPDDLLSWKKDPSNPVLDVPTGVGLTDFRDPSTAWRSPSGKTWLIAVGSSLNDTGAVLLFESSDFRSWAAVSSGPLFLDSGSQIGMMWECPDFFQAQTSGSIPPASDPYLLKASSDSQQRDFWFVGSYEQSDLKFRHDVSLQASAQLIDGGTYYASKTMFDPVQRRRVLFGWSREADSFGPQRGWQGVQTFPRVVTLELLPAHGYGDGLWWVKVEPVPEIAGLREGHVLSRDLRLSAAQPLSLISGVAGQQLEITANFTITLGVAGAMPAVFIRVHTDSGAATTFTEVQVAPAAPFGARLGVNREHSGTDGANSTQFADFPGLGGLQRSSSVSGATLTTSIRVLVDHSLVEAFADGGRAVVTSRVYPKAQFGGVAVGAHFAHASDASVAVDVEAFRMHDCWV
jgi:beta-fructofuranosidase